MENKKKIIIGIAGEMASGKTTAAEHINKTYGGRSYRFSTPLTEIAEILHIENSRTNLQALSTMLRKEFGEDLLAKVLYAKVKEAFGSTIVIDGIRRKEDILYLKAIPEFTLIYIDTSEEDRYRRLIGRKEKEDDATKSIQDFKKEQGHESEQEIMVLKEYAQEVVDNSSGVDSLYIQLDRIYSKLDAS